MTTRGSTRTCGVRILTLLALATLLAVNLDGNTPVHAGKPAPAPKLPKMRYQVQFWEPPITGASLRINNMNNNGQVVGWYVLSDGRHHGFIYDPAVDPEQA